MKNYAFTSKELNDILSSNVTIRYHRQLVTKAKKRVTYILSTIGNIVGLSLDRCHIDRASFVPNDNLDVSSLYDHGMLVTTRFNVQTDEYFEELENCLNAEYELRIPGIPKFLFTKTVAVIPFTWLYDDFQYLIRAYYKSLKDEKRNHESHIQELKESIINKLTLSELDIIEFKQ